MSPVAPHARGPGGGLEPGPATAGRDRGALGVGARLRSWAPLLVVLALATVPLFAHLGQPALWEDEGDTAVFARAIVRSGLPLAWDGQTFSDCDFGRA